MVELILAILLPVALGLGFWLGRRDSTEREAEVRRLGIVVEGLEARIATEEKETPTIYVQLQRMEQLLHNNTGKEMRELAEMMEKAGVEAPRMEKTIRPEVAQKGRSI